MSSNTPPPGSGRPGWGQPPQHNPGGGPPGHQGAGQPWPGQQGTGSGQGQPGQYGPPGQPGQYGPPGQPGQYGPPSAPGQPGQYGGPGGYGPDGPGPYGPGGQPPGSGSRGVRRGLVVVSIAVVVAVLIGGSAVAFRVLKDKFEAAGPQAAEAIPADAVFYVGIDLDPSAKQKVAALQFLSHFPAFKDASGVTDANSDIRQTIFEKALESSGCTDVSYAKDIKPWLGSKFAVAGMPPSGDGTDPVPIGAVEVSNQSAAKDGMRKLAGCGSDPSTFGIAFTGSYALIAETQEEADRYAKAADSGSLADDGDFSADMDSLGDVGVATAWVDIDGALDLFSPELPVGGSDSGLDLLRSTYQRAAVTFRFKSDHAELATTVYGDTPDVDHGDNHVVDLPDSTVFAASEAGGGKRLAQSWDDIKDAAAKSGVDIESQLQTFADQTGLTVPDDLETVLGDNLMLAVDSDGLTADALTAGDPSQLNAGVRFSGDKGSLESIYSKVEKLLQQEAGGDVPFVKKETDDGLVIATNDSYADALSDEGTLGDSDAFTSVVDDGAGQEFVLFFDFDQVEDQMLQAAQDGGAPSQVIDNLRPLQAIAITSSTDGQYTKGSFVVSVNN